MKSVGFEFQEVMSGSYTLASEPEESRRFSFRARAHAGDILKHLKDKRTELEGVLEMEGFADEVPIHGTLEIAPLSRKSLRYEFAFVGNDGEPYRFSGQKTIRFTSPLSSFTTLLGNVQDPAGQEVARVTARFDLRQDFLPFLVSWKPQLV